MADPRVSRQSDRCPDVTNVTDLWNTATAPLDQGTLDFLQTGDRCFVTFSKTMYLCTSPTPGAATWVPYPGSGGVVGDPVADLVFTFDSAGAVVAQRAANGQDITVSAVSHPSAGTYNFLLAGADKPTTYVPIVQVQGGVCVQAAKFGPASLSVGTARSTWAAGDVAVGGALTRGIGVASVNHVATGIVDITLDDTTNESVLTPTLAGTPVLYGVVAARVSTGVFRVQTFLLADTSAVDAGFAFNAQSIEPTVQFARQDYAGTVAVYKLT